MATYQRRGGEFRVNTQTVNSQQSPRITRLANGGFVATWQDNSLSGGDASGFGIKAQIYGANGVPVGPEFLVNTQTANSQVTPTITALNGGGFVVAWADPSLQGGDASASGIKAQIYDAVGGRVGGEFLVNSVTTGTQNQPSVGALASGGFVVAWNTASDGSGSGIVAQLYDAAGGRVGGEFPANTQTLGAQALPSVAGLPSGGFVLTWIDNMTDPASADVRAQLFAANGTKVGPEFLVNTQAAGSQTTPVVASLASGGFVIAWTDGGSGGGDASLLAVKAQRFDANGARIGTEFLVNSEMFNSQSQPAITALSNGGFVVSWTDGSGADGSGNTVKAQAFAADGSRDGGELLVNTQALNGQFAPTVTGTASGGFVITWTDNSADDGSGSVVKAQIFEAADGTNPVPVALDDSLAALEDSVATFTPAQLIGNDTSGDADTLALLGVYDAAGGTVARNPDGTIAFTPNPNFSGPGGFTYVVSDGRGGSDTGRAVVNVANVNDTPSFSAATTIIRIGNAQNTQLNGSSAQQVFSPDGGRIAFISNATNLVPNDTNDRYDVFVKDLATGAVTRVSTAANGGQASDDSFTPVFSPDGNSVAFTSVANNLVAGDTNVGFRFDIFVKNLTTGAIALVNRSASGEQGNNNSNTPVFSPDGTKILFESDSSNLVAGDTNQGTDLFVKDLTTGTITRVSTDGSGNQALTAGSIPSSTGASFSPDGTKIVFASRANNLVAGDTNGRDDIFVKDLVTGAVTRVSVAADGAQGNDLSYGSPEFSPDGTKILFESVASNLVAGDTNGSGDVFIKDLATGAITRVSTGSDGGQIRDASDSAVFSPDGTRVAFRSGADGIVAGDTNDATDIFVKDLRTGELTLVTANAAGRAATPGPEGSNGPTFSPDGRSLGFTSAATDLVAGDTNGREDVFIATLGSARAVSNDGAPVAVASAVQVGDVDSTNFAGGTLTVALVTGAAAGDTLSIASSGTGGSGTGGSGIEVAGNSVRFDGIEIGKLTTSPGALSVALDADATDAAVQALTEAVRFSSTSADAAPGTRTVDFTLRDGSGGANGVPDSASFSRAVEVSGPNDAPSAVAIAGDAVTFIRGGAAVRLDAGSNATIVDNDNNGFDVDRVGSGFTGGILDLQPVPDGSGRVFIAEKGGKIFMIDPAAPFGPKTLVLDVSASISTGGEDGLLGMATAPDFLTSGQFYVYVTNTNGDNEVRRYNVAPGGQVADPASADTILVIPHPTNNNHNGGWIAFGPDGYLYIATGDGGGSGDPAGNAQNKETLLGKILRIDVNTDAFPNDPLRDYAAPFENPFAGFNIAGRDEIFALGLRNPFRNSFDSEGNLYIADVGQGAREEVNQLRPGDAGANYGWANYEGTAVFRSAANPGFTFPVLEYGHNGGPRGGFSVTGGYVYEGPVESLQGKYIFADFVTGNIWAVPVADMVPGTTISADRFELLRTAFLGDNSRIDQVSSFGEDQAGNLYVLDFKDGEVFRVGASTETNFARGSLTIAITGGKVAGEDQLLIQPSGLFLTNGTAAGSEVVVGGVIIGRVAAGGSGLGGENLVIDFASGATAGRVSTLIQALAYNNANSGNATAGTRTITYTLVDGAGTANGGRDTLTFTTTVNVQADASLRGDAGDNVVVGTPNADFFDLSQGGNDNATGNGGDDAFYFGAAFTAADRVDGGAGNDQLGLQGNTNVTLTASSLVGIETLSLLSGRDASLGQSGTNRYSYTVTTNDANVAAGAVLNVYASTLRGDDPITTANDAENFTFNGSAETDGSFRTFGGMGVDTLTGGAGDDGFFFGPGRFGATDSVNGGAGTNDQLALDGSYTMTLGGNFTNIEVVVLLAGPVEDRNRFDLTANNATVAAGRQLTIAANGLATDFIFNGAAETDGSFRIFSGSGNDLLTGGAGRDIIYGGGGDDVITGGLGGDTIFGLEGADRLVYASAAQSTGLGFDTLGGFDFSADTIDLAGATPRTLNGTQNGGTLSTASFDADLATALDGMLTGNGAALFNPNAGDFAGRSFLVVDGNGDGVYTAGQDYVFELVDMLPPPVNGDFLV